MDAKFSSIQRAVLDALRGMEPRGVLTGGAALSGYYFGHRATRDLDFFFRGRVTLDEVPVLVETRLRAVGIHVHLAQSSPGFRRYDVKYGDETLEVDLVAEPVEAVRDAVEVEPGIYVDTPYEILVNKLTALLGRAAIRDLLDMKVLVDSGLDPHSALQDAARKDWRLQSADSGVGIGVAPGAKVSKRCGV